MCPAAAVTAQRPAHRLALSGTASSTSAHTVSSAVHGRRRALLPAASCRRSALFPGRQPMHKAAMRRWPNAQHQRGTDVGRTRKGRIRRHVGSWLLPFKWAAEERRGGGLGRMGRRPNLGVCAHEHCYTAFHSPPSSRCDRRTGAGGGQGRVAMAKREAPERFGEGKTERYRTRVGWFQGHPASS